MTAFRDQLSGLLREQGWMLNGIIDRLKLRLSIVERVAWLQSDGIL